MQLIGALLQWVLQIFLWMLLARFVIDLVMSFSRSWKPKGLMLVIAEVTFTVTDPPLKLVRRLLPNLKFGGAQIDLSFGVVWFACVLLMRMIPILFGA